MRVAGWTIVNASRQAKHRASRTNASRIGFEARRGVTRRSVVERQMFPEEEVLGQRGRSGTGGRPQNRTRSIPSAVPHAAQVNERCNLLP